MSDCIFCKIIDGDIPANKVYEDEKFLAFHDISPKAKVHVLIIPKKHIPTFMDVQEEDLSLMGELHRVIQDVAKKLDLDEQGFRVVNNCKEHGGQEVFHIHYHLLGGEKLSF
ncbi:histidine triad nucleotide-binding protein [Vulcanibacillus modesticaldus]|uniref:Histidine triad nucleotide-binding protein n=1 Tax=Vulcanibacillus modesticaldus TaxID=337097 RepID=A0A1D2YSC9_9BACI|nr:histidine triad nucleotide-binding protein [Vulcanibacillus modesticaldus]OEF96951.1 histidine triad nucleotide-binding protein [Vulcanibacillus modesticaldus]